MRITLLVLILIIAGISVQSCHKPDYTYRSPCNDTTLTSLYERRVVLTPAEQLTFDSLQGECAKYEAVQKNRGKLWLPILATIGGVVAVILLLVFAGGRPEQPGW